MTAETTLKSKITNAVSSAVKSPTTNATNGDTLPIAGAVINAVVPEILHATNNEPFWQSRVFWGSAISILAALLGIFKINFPSELQTQLVDLIMLALPAIGGAVALYGRFVARTPIGK